MKQPYSTWTNAAYLVVGAAIALYGDGAFSPWQIWVGLGCAALAAGSTAYHQGSRLLLDEMGMYACYVPLLAWRYYVLVPHAAIFAVAAVLSVVLVAYAHKIDLLVAVPALVALSVILVGLGSGGFAAGLLLLGLYAVALLVREISKSFGRERLRDLTHGLWHVWTAAAIYLTYIL